MPARIQPMSDAERSRRYRERRRASRNLSQPLSGAERQQGWRERRLLNQAHQSDLVAQDVSSRDPEIINSWRLATSHFEKVFKGNSSGHAFNVCDRLLFKNDIKMIKEQHLPILIPIFGELAQSFSVCSNCFRFLNRKRLPNMSTSNGFHYPPKPEGLPELNPVSIRLISPRIPFMSIQRLRRDGQYGIVGQVINIPIDVDDVVQQLPRRLDDDYSFYVSLKRRLIHKSSYLSGFVQKRNIKLWLKYLVDQPLYKHFNITIDWRALDESHDTCPHNQDLIEELETTARDNQHLLSRQRTLLWNEESVLDIAPGQRNRPLNIIFDNFAEKLSFPQIYYEVGRCSNPNISVTRYMIANSEIRRKNRRGVTSDHILYQATTVLRE